MVDQDTTTDDSMTTDTTPAGGTDTFPTTAPDPQSPQAPALPPSVEAPVDDALRWLVNVTTMAGPPDAIDISTTIRHIGIAIPNRMLFARWQAIIGAVTQPILHDALGSTVFATTMYPGLWSVTIHAHVRPTS